ncbi:hypothetical protein ACRQ5Q_14665 [Bradyrhizobium sp. PMVTL-01]|uniref:hypothetical protein n=1 Tax=Bradyrhizobium sp. PMVTL-01 TaxID=3434999 RepID=UPI003F70D32C
MADTIWTTMHIGGALPSNLIEDFLDEIKTDFSYECQSAPDSEDDIRVIVKDRVSLLLQAHVAGSPDNVIRFCKDHGMPFWVHYDAGYEWESYIVIWRPSMVKEEECPASSQGYTPQADLADLRRWLAAGWTLERAVEEVSRFESSNVPALTITEVAEAKEDA